MAAMFNLDALDAIRARRLDNPFSVRIRKVLPTLRLGGALAGSATPSNRGLFRAVFPPLRIPNLGLLDFGALLTAVFRPASFGGDLLSILTILMPSLITQNGQTLFTESLPHSRYHGMGSSKSSLCKWCS